VHDQPGFLLSQPDDGLQLAWFADPEGRLRARAWCGPATAGPPGHVHGGCMAALLDEVVGGAAWLAGHPVVAATLSVKFRAMLPVGTVISAVGRVDGVHGRRVSVSGELLGPGGVVHASAEGIFVVLQRERLGGMAPELRAAVEVLMARVERPLP
jgi:acyl-coenzyme A thioesterase PaaI-like protein